MPGLPSLTYSFALPLPQALPQHACLEDGSGESRNRDIFFCYVLGRGVLPGYRSCNPVVLSADLKKK